MRSILLAALVLLAPTLLGAVAASAHDGDAGTGSDAGNTIDTALAVPAGTFQGTVSYPGDDTDIFRFDLPESTGLRMVVTPLTGSLFLYTLHDRGHIDRSSEVSSEPIEVRAVAYGGTVHLAVHAATEYVAYRVEASVMPRFDLAVTSVTLTPIDPAGVLREVRVEVANEGAAHNSQAILVVRALHDDGAVRYVGWDGSWQIAPQGSRVFTFRWDTPGETGDVRLVAEVEFDADEDRTNNAIVVETSVLLPGESQDALNKRTDFEAGGTNLTLLWMFSTGSNSMSATYFVRADSPFAYAEARPMSVFAGFPVFDPLFE